jgi:hypothetical protein
MRCVRCANDGDLPAPAPDSSVHHRRAPPRRQVRTVLRAIVVHDGGAAVVCTTHIARPPPQAPSSSLAYRPMGGSCPSRNRHHRACFSIVHGVDAPPLVTMYAPSARCGDGEREKSPIVRALRIQNVSSTRRFRSPRTGAGWNSAHVIQLCVCEYAPPGLTCRFHRVLLVAETNQDAAHRTARQ